MTLDQLLAFTKVVQEGSFQAAADAMHISQPSVSAAVKKLEAEFDLQLFSREGYRAEITQAGQAFYQKAKATLMAVEDLTTFARVLAGGEEPELGVALNELVPFDLVLQVLSHFFSERPHTKLKLYCEGVRGALEKVEVDQASVGITGFMPGDTRYEHLVIGEVQLIPVCSKDYPLAKLRDSLTPYDLHKFTQVITRDTSTIFDDRDFGVVEGATSSFTVSDFESKKKVLLAGLGWGRLPHYAIQDEINRGTFVSLLGSELNAVTIPICVVRKHRPHGPVCESLWNHIAGLAQDGHLIR